MICPHCERNLLRKERTGNRCTHCKRSYALDPKTNPLRLNDLRVRRITTALTDGGRIAIVPDQLWYALSRKRLRDSDFGQGCLGGAFAGAGFATVVALFAEAPALLIASGALLIIGLGISVARVMGAGKGIPPVVREGFPALVLSPWRSVYGGLPPGVLDPSAYGTGTAGAAGSANSARSADPAGAAGAADPAGAEGTTGVLVCPDRAVVAFLVADGLPARHGLAVVRSPAEAAAVPSNGPVLVLHDTDADGELLVRGVREALPGRTVVDVGPPLRTVRSLPQAVPYRDPRRRPGPADLRILTALGTYTPEELKWLGQGWRFPLVGLPPARLLAVVDRVAGQVSHGADPDRRRAADLGFLTWPEAAGPDPVGGR
ncbi:hypothetical protein MBT42_35995 [Streptomyces sp. MBT42]|uniref:hypothetical protein n=1 Tax=Streptomyces sp. MBT42 TaxID=1488373 RepID=UPI001E3872DE|nr:hypothetical protein [Streptomyces sp. MBT42]MCD2468941.1 hypothetical protein [Streptomyces sp. MBT42]